MKTLIYAWFCFLVATCAFAEDYPARSFPSKEAAVTFAKARPLGGFTQELEIAKKQVIVLYRGGSGAFTEDAAIYVKMGDGYILLAYYAVNLAGSTIEASGEGRSVVLKAKRTKDTLFAVSVDPKE